MGASRGEGASGPVKSEGDRRMLPKRARAAEPGGTPTAGTQRARDGFVLVRTKGVCREENGDARVRERRDRPPASAPCSGSCQPHPPASHARGADAGGLWFVARTPPDTP